MADGSIWLLTYVLAVLMCLVDLRSLGAWGDLHRKRVRREAAEGGLHLMAAEQCWQSRGCPLWRATSVTELLQVTVRDAEQTA